MKVPPRTLAKGQRCEVWVHDVAVGENRMIFSTTDLLLEAPNWALDGDALILNGNGTLTLTGASTYSGGTTISTSGSLVLAGNDRLLTTGTLALSAGTFNLGAGSNTIAALTLNQPANLATGSAITVSGTGNMAISGTTGAVTVGGETHAFEPASAFGILDWGRGVWTWDNTWYWGSASGLHEGRPFGFNIGHGFGETKCLVGGIDAYSQEIDPSLPRYRIELED